MGEVGLAGVRGKAYSAAALMSAFSRMGRGPPARATLIMARPTFSEVVTYFGNSHLSSGNNGRISDEPTRIHRVRDATPCSAWMAAGRNTYLPLNGMARMAFSAWPFT